MGMQRRELTPKQKRFVQEFLIDLNSTQACIRAGYSEKNADQTGPKLAKKSRVAKAILEGIDSRAMELGLNAAGVVKELMRIAYLDPGDVLDFTGEEPRLKPAKDIPERARRAISKIKTKRYVEGRGEDAKTVEIIEFAFWDKNVALDKLARHLGMFIDRKEHTGKDGSPLFNENTVQRIVVHHEHQPAAQPSQTPSGGAAGDASPPLPSGPDAGDPVPSEVPGGPGGDARGEDVVRSVVVIQ